MLKIVQLSTFVPDELKTMYSIAKTNEYGHLKILIAVEADGNQDIKRVAIKRI